MQKQNWTDWHILGLFGRGKTFPFYNWISKVTLQTILETLPTILEEYLQQGAYKTQRSVFSAATDTKENTVELEWLKHLWDQENMVETGVVRANEY